MVVVELPEADVDDVEIFIAEEVGVEVDVWFCLDIEEGLEDVGAFELAEAHLVVVFSVRHIVHSVDHAEGVPFLELRCILREVQPWMQL